MARRVSSPVLVGRDAELAQLGAVLERAASGQPAIVLVTGEAGVGKTRLVAELLDHAAQDGVVTLDGGCLDVGEGALAYAPMVEALRTLARSMDPEDLDRMLAGARGELSRLVPELGPQGGEKPSSTLAPTRLFELLLGVLHRLAERGPVLLVVEDLHWTDRSTRDLLGFLVRNLRGGVALVLSYRSDELHRRHPLRSFLAELDRSGRVERLELARLDRQQLARRILDDASAPLDPPSATPVYASLAEAAIWDDRLPDARAAVADGLAVPADSEEPYWTAELRRAGLAMEAAAAEHARARRAADDERAARELASGLIERVRAATSAGEVVTTPVVEANTRTAEAEWSRVAGPSDPGRGAASARAWEAVGFPWPPPTPAGARARRC